MSRVIQIQSNQGLDICPVCSHCDTETCDFCDDGDHYEENYEMDEDLDLEPIVRIPFRKFRKQMEKA